VSATLGPEWRAERATLGFACDKEFFEYENETVEKSEKLSLAPGFSQVIIATNETVETVQAFIGTP